VLAALARNQHSSHSEGLSVQEVDVGLDEGSLRSYLLGREVFFETDYIALRRAGEIALVAVGKEPIDVLFARVVELRLLAGPDEVAWVDAPTTDTSNATALALAARANGRRGARAYLVQGRYNHVNFIWEPELLPVVVRDVVPPEPPKLFTMAEQVVAFDTELPPIELILDAVDIGDLAAQHPAPRYLLQCRGSGVDLGTPTDFLDTHPPQRRDWLLIGCELSLQMHRHFYGDEPSRVDTCPVRRADPPTHALAKCCLIGDGVDLSGRSAAVKWGASLADIRRALRALAGVDDPAGLEPAAWLLDGARRPARP
jgi:hypothetical protein